LFCQFFVLRSTGSFSVESVCVRSVFAEQRLPGVQFLARARQGRMAQDFSNRKSVDSARKWHALAERRRRHFVDLYRSDRWRRYYSEEAFLAQMRDVIESVEMWAKVIERAPGGAEQPKSVQH
jgi:hypothetical protein